MQLKSDNAILISDRETPSIKKISQIGAQIRVLLTVLKE
jgi:hypothetical protein